MAGVPLWRVEGVPGVTSLDLTWAVRSVDSLLRQRQGIEDITDDEECILRMALAVSDAAVTLSDGIMISPGDPVVRMHYRNEHLPAMPAGGPNAAWATLFMNRLRHSFRELAHRIECDPQLAAVRAIQGAPAFAHRFGNAVQLSRICEKFGFEVVALDHRGGLGGRVHDVLDSMLVWGLIWAFNPGGLKNHGLSHRRIQVWMSRRKLLSLYGRSSVSGPAGRERLIKDVESL